MYFFACIQCSKIHETIQIVISWNRKVSRVNEVLEIQIVNKKRLHNEH